MKYAISGAPKKRAANRRNALKIGLAGIAVAGVGAALTSAAWTDNVWFQSPADGASFNLKASLTGASDSWTETSQAQPLPIPAAVFEKLVPGETRKVKVHVLNDSNVPAAIVPTVSQDGLTDVTLTANAEQSTLQPQTSTTVEITLTTPTTWDVVNKGQSATIALVVEGKTN